MTKSPVNTKRRLPNSRYCVIFGFFRENNLIYRHIPNMNKIVKALLLLVLFCSAISKLKSQTLNYDSLFAEREKIILAGVDYRHYMIHWDALRLSRSMLDISLERKMNLNLSWIARMTWNYSMKRGGLYPNVGIRYYYNLEERIMKRWQRSGLKTSCFSADYFQADFTMGYNWGYKYQGDALPNQNQNNNNNNNGGNLPYQKGLNIGPALKIGTQRPLFRKSTFGLSKYEHFFYDAFIGCQIMINYKARIIGGFTLAFVI